MKTLNTIILCLTLMLMASCDLNTPYKDYSHRHTDDLLRITNTHLYDDYSKATLYIHQTKDIDKYNIADSTKVSIKIDDSYCHLIPLIKGAQPKMTSIRYIVPEMVWKEGMTAIVLVDLSQPAPILNNEREYVRRMSSIFNHNNLYLAFMLPDGKVTKSMVATDYVISNYIDIMSPLLHDMQMMPSDSEMLDSIALPKKNRAYLFRSVSRMLYDISGHTGTAFDNAQKKLLVILSDGQIYDEATNMPLDPDHFAIQERLINQSRNLPENASVFYINLANTNIKASVKDVNMMHMLCMQSNGKYITDLEWGSFLRDMLHSFNIPDNDYVMEMDIPEGKICLGSMRNLNIKAYKLGTDSIIGEGNKEYVLGSLSVPIIVGSDSYMPIYIRGIFLTLLVMAIIYIVLQIIIPFVRYRIFRSKYVVRYTGENMSVQGRLVSDTCYFCKAPFNVGDRIVAKCNHTMHEECWHENDQHCPEYGKQCPEGSHFYDSLNILNPRNGSYIIKWLIPAVAVSALVWIVMAYFNREFSLFIIDDICSSIKSTKADNINIDVLGGTNAIMSISPRMSLLPLFGFYLTPLLTMLFAFLASYHRQWGYRLVDISVRALVVMVISLAVFFTEFLIILVNDIYDGSVLYDWIPWTIVTYVVLTASTYNTRITDLHNRTKVLVSIAIGVVNAILWDILGTYETKNHVTLFVLFFILYGVVLAVTIARKLPASEKYFLHVKGEIKEMDIALYKWLRQAPDAFVSIGRSTECLLRISWDMDSNIAPVHAIIRKHKGIPHIHPADGDVIIDNKVVGEGKSVRLHHGMTIHIGTTSFTYLEA